MNQDCIGTVVILKILTPNIQGENASLRRRAEYVGRDSVPEPPRPAVDRKSVV